jgi:hypothetical protein
VDGTVFVHSGFAGYGSPFPEPSVDGNSYIAALRARDGVPYWQRTRGAVGGLVMGSVDGGV